MYQAPVAKDGPHESGLRANTGEITSRAPIHHFDCASTGKITCRTQGRPGYPSFMILVPTGEILQVEIEILHSPCLTRKYLYHVARAKKLLTCRDRSRCKCRASQAGIDRPPPQRPSHGKLYGHQANYINICMMSLSGAAALPRQLWSSPRRVWERRVDQSERRVKQIYKPNFFPTPYWSLSTAPRTVIGAHHFFDSRVTRRGIAASPPLPPDAAKSFGPLGYFVSQQLHRHIRIRKDDTLPQPQIASRRPRLRIRRRGPFGPGRGGPGLQVPRVPRGALDDRGHLRRRWRHDGREPLQAGAAGGYAGLVAKQTAAARASS
ncbi:hypothetical protein GGX14DRAFT_596059 [Mycena pura]|uniref:Uncharacterized protein n=1 Tax=Mycena pura TaxID=153505 RepID=A0AAD6UPW1_9AGAR|nr:hypothetical protein GGX14DRAFT_596059 [Mycena pura]